MSDGPHRSLPMPRSWRELSKRADQVTYDLSEVTDGMERAIASDFKNEVSPTFIAGVKKVFVGPDNSLRIPEIALDQLGALRQLVAGSEFETTVVAWCVQIVHEGRINEVGMHDAFGSAIRERLHKGIRQVEEHYHRRSNERRADGVRGRLESAAASVRAIDLGRQFLQPHARPAKSTKKASIDDGVRL